MWPFAWEFLFFFKVTSFHFHASSVPLISSQLCINMWWSSRGYTEMLCGISLLLFKRLCNFNNKMIIILTMLNEQLVIRQLTGFLYSPDSVLIVNNCLFPWWFCVDKDCLFSYRFCVDNNCLFPYYFCVDNNCLLTSASMLKDKTCLHIEVPNVLHLNKDFFFFFFFSAVGSWRWDRSLWLNTTRGRHRSCTTAQWSARVSTSTRAMIQWVPATSTKRSRTVGRNQA